MKNLFKQNKGFSLIELLVVVLIIGVLTAIIVPSYEKATEKGRAADAVSALRGLEYSARERIMAHRGLLAVESLADIGVALSAGEMLEDGTWDTKDWTYSLSGTASKWEIFATRKTGDYALVLEITPGSNGRGVQTKRRCKTKSTSVGKYVCKYLEPEGWKKEG